MSEVTLVSHCGLLPAAPGVLSDMLSGNAACQIGLSCFTLFSGSAACQIAMPRPRMGPSTGKSNRQHVVLRYRVPRIVPMGNVSKHIGRQIGGVFEAILSRIQLYCALLVVIWVSSKPLVFVWLLKDFGFLGASLGSSFASWSRLGAVLGPLEASSKPS